MCLSTSGVEACLAAACVTKNRCKSHTLHGPVLIIQDVAKLDVIGQQPIDRIGLEALFYLALECFTIKIDILVYFKFGIVYMKIQIFRFS